MNLGQLLGGAGVVGQGQRQAEEAARISRQNQLAIEEQNRLADRDRQIAAQYAQRTAGLAVPQFSTGGTQQYMQPDMPMGALPGAPGAFAAPGAPGVPSAARSLPPGVQPSQAGAGRGMVNPPLAGAPLAGQPQMTPQEIQRARDRAALLAVPMAALDVVQAPVAAGLNIFGSVAAGTQNFAGRVVNAVTGEATLPTETEYRKFPMTPFYDRFVRQPEEALAQQQQPGGAPAPPQKQAGTTPAAPTKAAQQYDAKVTPYDAIIAQSAQQYGIDPTVFKRLIGTESSFNVNAVSPRGEKFGLGIAQIADVHGLTREQRLDPNTALPFAAQLFSQYLQQSGGDYERAIQKYKGASSAGGKAAMSGPINTILSGMTPSAQAAPAAGGPPTTLEVPRTQARNMEMAEFYLAKPESVPYEMQQLNQMAQQQAAVLTQRRNEAARMQQIYGSSNTRSGIETAQRMQGTIDQLDDALLGLQQQVGQKQMYLQGMQGLRELAEANDPRRLSGVLSQMLGMPVAFQPRPDGKWNRFVNGQKVQEGLTIDQVSAGALKSFSPEDRERAAKSAALENELALKLRYDPQRDVAKIKAAEALQQAIINGEYKIAEERAKQLQGKLTVDTSKGVAYFQQGNRVFVINPDGKVEETPLGKIELPPTARPVAGLNMGR